MTRVGLRNLVSFIVGLVFALGLGLSGMTNPANVIGFLDPMNWNPSLLFVMGGALAVHATLYPLIRRRPSPLLDPEWHVSTKSEISKRLVIGSAIFGIGWGIGGFCPGPGVTSVASGDSRAVVFVATMVIGMLAFKKFDRSEA